jgi:20S proteasome alpha/beta subunit
MTYIAAFNCLGGIVMCADTQETVGDYKNYVEKLSILDDLSYPLAIGGAGIGDLVDCATDEILQAARSEKPKNKKLLLTLVRDAIKRVFEDDAPLLVLGRQWRSMELLIGAMTEEGFCILRTKGKRVWEVTHRYIIGFPSQYNINLLERMHRPDLSIQQAVMLGIYLVSQSKNFDGYVGGDTSVAIVRDNGAWIDDPIYIADAEKRVKQFLEITDKMFLTSIDVSISPSDYPGQFAAMANEIDQLRSEYLHYTAARTLERVLTGDYRGDPYPKVFRGAVTEISGSGPIRVREITEEEAVQQRDNLEFIKKFDQKRVTQSVDHKSEDQPSPCAEESPEKES